MSGGIRTNVKGYIVKRVTLAGDTVTRSDDSADKEPQDQSSFQETRKGSYGTRIKGAESWLLNDSNASSVSVPSTPRTVSKILQPINLKSFCYHKLRSATSGFSPDRIVGRCPNEIVFKGTISNGNIFKGVFKKWIDGRSLTADIAIKRRTLESLHQERTFHTHKDWLAEVNCLGQLAHPNLVKLIGYCSKDSMRILVFEFMPHGSLEANLFRRGSQSPPLPWNLRMKIALGAAKGLAFLHSEANAIHGEFTTSKILLDSNYNAKIGLAMEGLRGYRSQYSECADPEYNSVTDPRLVLSDCLCSHRRNATCDKKGHLPTFDVYSFGVVLLEMLTGRRAFDKNRPLGEENLVLRVRGVKFDSKDKVGQILDVHFKGQYPLHVARKALKLAVVCLSANPMNRPGMNEVVKEMGEIQSSSE